MVDGQLVVQMWNGQAEELFGLRLDEVRNRALLELDVGLPLAELAEPLRAVLRGSTERVVVAVAATNRRGRAFRSRVTILPLDADAESTYGAVLLIEADRSGPGAPSPPVADVSV